MYCNLALPLDRVSEIHRDLGSIQKHTERCVLGPRSSRLNPGVSAADRDIAMPARR